MRLKLCMKSIFLTVQEIFANNISGSAHFVLHDWQWCRRMVMRIFCNINKADYRPVKKAFQVRIIRPAKKAFKVSLGLEGFSGPSIDSTFKAYSYWQRKPIVKCNGRDQMHFNPFSMKFVLFSIYI